MLVIGIDPGISGSICFFQDGEINDVIEMHQGDAKISSDAYFDLDLNEQEYLIEFLKSFK